PAGLVGADGEQVRVGVGRDPHVAPGRRYDERLDAGDVLGRERGAVDVEVAVAAAVPDAGPARVLARDGAEAGHRSSFAESSGAPGRAFQIPAVRQPQTRG